MQEKKSVAKPQITSCMIGEDMALMDVQGGTYFTLNTVGAEIWNALSSPCTEEKLVSHITEMFTVDESECRNDVIAILADLKKEGLVEETN